MSEDFVEDIINNTTEEAAVEIETVANNADAADQAVKTDEQPKVAEESSQEAAQEVVEETATDQAPVEALAEKLGWNKDHQGEDKVDASTYILRSREIQDTMRDHNKDLKGQVSSLNDSIKALQKHNENVYKVEVKKLEADLTALKKEKREAVELADVDKVDELDEQIENIQKDLNAPKDVDADAVTGNPVYDVWVKDNQWYVTDNEMAAYADTVAEQYSGAPLDRIYSLVQQKVKEVFPDKFDVPEQVAPVKQEVKKPVGPKSPVEAGANRESKAAFTVDSLTPSQRSTMEQFVKMEIMTEQQYVDDIAKMQEG